MPILTTAEVRRRLLDPRIHPEQYGLPSNASKGEEGVNYLRRLKGEMANRTDSGSSGNGNASATSNSSPSERRRSTRLRCSGSVEFQVLGSEVRMWGTLTDISPHGCYVEMSNTFPVNTRVHLVLKSCGIRVTAVGTVRASYPALGMGICFAEMDPEQQRHLVQLVDKLSGQAATSNKAPGREAVTQTSTSEPDPKALLAEITEFFRTRPLLSREEFYQIAKRVRRS